MTKFQRSAFDRLAHGTAVALSLTALLAAVACGGATEESAEPAPAAPAPTEARQPVALDRSILDDPSRPEAERDQDAGRRPLDVYEFFGVQPGQTVADVFNADGYNTHLLSRAVGDAGRVYSVFEFYGVEELFDGQFYKVPAVTQRLDDAGLDNVELAMHLTEVPSASVDVAIAIRSYHDVEWVFPDLKRAEQVAEFFRVVKPGGFVGIVEVSTPVEGWDNAAHRLNRQVVIDDFTAAGFELAEESDLLANPADDHAQQGFPERHKTDRYTLKFRKPGS